MKDQKLRMEPLLLQGRSRKMGEDGIVGESFFLFLLRNKYNQFRK